NMDGHIDIVAANSTADFQGGIQVWLGNGGGEWQFEAGPTITGKYMDAVVADFNGDGRPDIAGAGWGTYGSLRVWLGEGSGGWKATEVVGKGSFYRLTPGDINGDGLLDIITGTYRKGVSVFAGDGQGNFSEITGPDQVPVPVKRPGSDAGSTFDRMNRAYSYWQALPIDLQKDGRMGILAGSPEDKGIKLWELLNDGRWIQADTALPETGTVYDIATADIDKDGYEEILAAGFGDGIKAWSTRGGKITAKEIHTRGTYELAAKTPVAEHTTENQVFVVVNDEPQYKIGPQDVLEIINWQGVEAKKEEVRVTADGKISIGFIDDLAVAGLTERQLDEKITVLMGRYIKNPSIDVRVKEYKSHSVMILGAIQTSTNRGPGRYNLSGRT
ncbi:MAG: hypothetical protein GY697_24425, partial [Desulfobacterales bacterium]|nr:hypothetical protein [Desulfobacterales bacterium]